MWNINFFFGMLAYLRTGASRIGVVADRHTVASSCVALAPRAAYRSIEAQQGLPKDLLALGVPFFLILLGFALAERRHGFVRAGPYWCLAKRASYAIYLVHSAAISDSLSDILSFSNRTIVAQSRFLVHISGRGRCRCVGALLDRAASDPTHPSRKA